MTNKIKIKLSNIADIRLLVETARTFNQNINVIEKHYRVDAKSIMGVFSLDLSQPVMLESDEPFPPKFVECIEPFIIR